MSGKKKTIFISLLLCGLIFSSFFFGKKISVKNHSRSQEKIASSALLLLPPPKNVPNLPPPQVNASSFLIVDLTSSEVLAQKNVQTPLPIASITKLLTAILAIENLPLNEEILITKEILQAHGTTPVLKEGEKIKIKDLLYPLLIESSNDAAEAIGSYLGREKTVSLMNQIAQRIFMKNAKFFDPSGFDPRNVASVQDLFYLAKYILNSRPEILKITRGETPENLFPEKIDPQKLSNKNIFSKLESFVGGKGGYLDEAKYTGVFIFKAKDKEGKERYLLFIILGADGLTKETLKLISWTKENFPLEF
jgi:D-alanyl-D-alanine carboxypeptidase